MNTVLCLVGSASSDRGARGVGRSAHCASAVVCAWLGVALVAGAFAQGTVLFSNYDRTVQLDAPVTDYDGTPLAGAGFLAQLYGGPTPESLRPVSSPTPFAADGYFSGGRQPIMGVAMGNMAFVQVHAWEASGTLTYEAALQAGRRVGTSNLFLVWTGGDG
ncbi:MAG: hypothetical protein FJ387_00945 [Verrucomicrobia bacterium]|nr:hypothetical protein [Verrucomicrobiota bacterium]